MARNDFTDLANLTARHFDQVGGGFGRVISAFQRAAGPELAQVATPVSLRSGVLKVRCASAAWAQAIGFMEHDLLSGLRAQLPGTSIDRISASAGAAPAPSAPPPAPPPPPLDAAAEQRLEELVAPIADPALRARVLAAARAAERARRQRCDPAR